MTKAQYNLSDSRLQQLKNYTALSAAFLTVCGSANAQIVYQDVNPDLNVYLEDIPIDMDNDGTNDFKLVFLSEPFATFAPNEIKVRINPIGDNLVAYSFQTIPVTYSGVPYATYFAGATEVVFTNIPTTNEGEIINEDINFHSNIGVLYEKLFFYIYSSYNIQSFIGGNWNGVTDHFAAVKLFSDDTYHYGWMRLSVSAETGIVLKDYAFELTPETPITTVINQLSIEWITAGDYGITETASDLQFDFNAVGNEAAIEAYQVICVKADVEDFTVADANALLPEQYVTIIPDGSAHYAQAFPSTAYDSDGDLIVANQSYKLYVLNVMQPAENYTNILSAASPSFTLLNVVSTAMDLSIADINNNGNGSDIRINFNSASTEQGIAEYRICIAEKDAADSFLLEDALALTPDRYTTVLPGLLNYEIYLSADALDTDGNLIQPNRYKAFVVSIPDGSTVNIAAITPVSNVILLETETSTVNATILSDIAETGTGADISIQFPAPAFEQTIEDYRVFLVDFTTAFDFNLDAALLSENYISITPTGTDVEIIGDATMVDIEGNAITWGVPYYVYILSIASEFGISDTLSLPSNQLILNFPVVIPITSASLTAAQIFVTENVIQIHLSEEPNQATYQLIDLNGKIVSEGKLTNKVNIIPIDVPAATYLVRVLQGGEPMSQKITIGY